MTVWSMRSYSICKLELILKLYVLYLSLLSVIYFALTQTIILMSTFYSTSTTLQILFFLFLSKIHEFYPFNISAYDQFSRFFFNTRDCWFFNHFNIFKFLNTLLYWKICSQKSIDMCISHDHIIEYLESLSLKWLSKIVGYHDMSGTIIYRYFLLSTLSFTKM